MKKLGFGCMRFPLVDREDPTAFDKEQIIKMVDCFLEQGFTYFDTAYMYHKYKSECIVKEVLVDRHPRDSFLLADKMPTMFLKKQEDVERIFNEQLEKTGAEYFDYYLLHCLDEELYAVAERFNLFDFAMQKKKEGKIKKFGFSFHDTAEVLDKILTEHNEVEFVQLQINYLDWESEKVQSKKCHQVAVKHGKEIIVMEPVKGGTLANIPPKAKRLFEKCNADASTASWAVRFAAGLDNVSMVLSGMSNMEQVIDNTSYMKDFVHLNLNEVETCFKAAEIIANSNSVPCTACRYCVDGCPENIAIPEIFSLYNKALEVESALNEDKDLISSISRCLECGQCEDNCPQHIEVIGELKNILKYFKD